MQMEDTIEKENIMWKKRQFRPREFTLPIFFKQTIYNFTFSKSIISQNFLKER